MSSANSNQLPPTDPGQPYDRKHVADLIQRIKDSADKLEADRTARGDLKILSRTLRELRYAFKVFRPYRSRPKVTVFGSARTPTDHPTYEHAKSLGKAMADQDWLVVTGAASGIMEAGHVGAGREHSMGLNIMLPFEQDANEVIRDDHKLVNMKYFFTRKLMFVKECNAVVCLPGGFGTLDEGLEVLTLLQTGKREMVPVVFLDEPNGRYWDDFDDFIKKRLLGNQMISEDDLSLYKVTDSVEETVEELLQFYNIYDSQRFVKGKMVFRLKEKLHPSLLSEINQHYSDILASGEFTQLDTGLEEERDEPDVMDLPRLVFHFNRRSLGRLRQLIDAINRGSLIA